MSISTELKELLYAEEMDEALIVLVTLEHEELPTPLRVTSDGQDTVSRGETYVYCPFNMKLAIDDPQQPPKASIEISNVDREIVQALRSIRSAVQVTIEIVRSGDLDTVEVSFPNFLLTSATYDALTVSGELNMEDFSQEPYPAGKYTPSKFPGMF